MVGVKESNSSNSIWHQRSNAAGWGEDDDDSQLILAKAGFALKTIKGGFAGMDESIKQVSGS